MSKEGEKNHRLHPLKKEGDVVFFECATEEEARKIRVSVCNYGMRKGIKYITRRRPDGTIAIYYGGTR